jgi:hypothetical protein
MGVRVMVRCAHGDRVSEVVRPVTLSPCDPDTYHPSPDHPRPARRLRLIGAGVALVVLLAGCASSPEAARVRGERGADPGNRGNPVVLLAPPDRVDRVYYEVPYDGPAAASADTSQS